MILSREKIIDRYPNGQIKYIETRAVIAPLWTAKYPNKRISENGKQWVRIGENIKFDKYGSVEWSIKYDKEGNLQC